MTVPNIKNFKERAGEPRKMMGLGAAAAVAIVGATMAMGNPGAAQNNEQPQAIPVAMMEQQASFYQDLGGFAPQAPTAGRPYYLMELNADTKQAYPGFGPNDIILAESASKDKIVVFNFVREGHPPSREQTRLIEDAMGQAAPQSRFQDMMLVNVSIADEDGTPVYAADFATLYEQNQLIDYNGSSNTLQAPYMSMYGLFPVENRNPEFQQVGTYALMNGVKTDADLRRNAEALFMSIGHAVTYYNNNSPQLVSSLERDNAPAQFALGQ